jgi:hypothetical protein
LAFAQVLKLKNKLAGSCSELTKRTFSVGNHKVLHTNVGVVLAFLDSDRIAEKELMSLPARMPFAKTFLVVCPDYNPDSANLSMLLEDKKILCRKFDDVIKEDFEINFDSVLNDSADRGFKIPAIQHKEKAGYNEYKYKCDDIIEFVDEEVGNRQIRVKINGNVTDIRYSEAALFMFMCIKLKESNGGWVSLEDMQKQGIVPEPEQLKTNDFTRMHRLISDLRKTIKKCASAELIEGVKGKGQYRISTHPNRVKEPGSNWLKKTCKHTVMPAVQAEREKRTKSKEYDRGA